MKHRARRLIPPGFLSQPCSIRHFKVWAGQDYFAVGEDEAGGKDFGFEVCDLLYGEIRDAQNLLAEELLLGVALGDLGRTIFDPYLGSEVNFKFKCWFSCFWEIINLNNGACSQIYIFKILPGDCIHYVMVFVQRSVLYLFKITLKMRFALLSLSGCLY